MDEANSVNLCHGDWRRQLEPWAFAGMQPVAPGRKSLHGAKNPEFARLKHDEAKLIRELESVHKPIGLGNKASAMGDHFSPQEGRCSKRSRRVIR